MATTSTSSKKGMTSTKTKYGCFNLAYTENTRKDLKTLIRPKTNYPMTVFADPKILKKGADTVSALS